MAGPQSVQWGLGIQTYVLGSQVKCSLPYEATDLHTNAGPGGPDVGVHGHSAAQAKPAARGHQAGELNCQLTSPRFPNTALTSVPSVAQGEAGLLERLVARR